VNQGGNVDYWGLEVERAGQQNAQVASPKPETGAESPCWVDTAETHKLVVAGNTFARNGRAAATALVDKNKGLIRWSKEEDQITTYFRTNAQVEEVSMVLEGSFGSGVTLQVSFGGETRIIKVDGGSELDLGTWKIAKAGYQKLVLEGLERSSATFAELVNVMVTGQGVFNYNPESDHYTPGRRGSAVALFHTGYETNQDVQYWYSELEVPEGEDPVGSYFMANGFQGGYFGMQVISETERRLIFSVWSPYKTHNMWEVPED